MNLWIFPGQPLQREPTVPDDDLFRTLDQLCQERCGYNLTNHLPLAGHRLSHHTMLQVYGVAMSLYRARTLRADGMQPDLVAEHSLGIYAALAVCGCLSEGDALELACRIGSCMARMGLQQPYMLGCAIGISRREVELAVHEAGAFIANYNSSSHFLLAGPQREIESALLACQAAGAFSTSSFPCEAPLHTPLMAAITDELAAIVQDYRFTEPFVPLIEHYEQTRLTASSIPGFLVAELLQPVYWEQTWKSLRTQGFSRCIEVGSGQALTKFNRWIDAEESR